MGVTVRWGQGGEEAERQPQVIYRRLKLLATGTVPTDDVIELAQSLYQPRVWPDARNAQLVKPGAGNSVDGIGKLNQRLDDGGHPHFGVIGAQVLHGRQGHQAVANGPRPDQQSPLALRVIDGAHVIDWPSRLWLPSSKSPKIGHMPIVSSPPRRPELSVNHSFHTNGVAPPPTPASCAWGGRGGREIRVGAFPGLA